MPGVQFRPDKQTTEQIIALYQGGMGSYDICKALGLTVHNATILRFLERNGIATRRRYQHGGTITCQACGDVVPKTHHLHKWCVECAPGPRWRAICNKYGIGKKGFEKKFAEQNGLCGVCQKPMSFDLDKIVVDHCHEQGHVRDILHNKCNIGLHYVEDSEFVGLAVKYIERHRR